MARLFPSPIPPLRLLLAPWGYPPQDHREAATWYKRAADQDNAPALNVVGVLYATGKGVPKDPREAVIWYHRSADIGYAPAQYNLGRATYNGDGTPLDRELAATWCRRAADQGYANAQFSLGWMYEGYRHDSCRNTR